MGDFDDRNLNGTKINRLESTQPAVSHGKRPEVSRLELILGPMTAGKSSELRRRLKRKALYKTVLAVSHMKDTRSEHTGIFTHDGVVHGGIAVSDLKDLLGRSDYGNADVIGIDEGQFFTDIPDFIRDQLRNTHKTFIISGLDGDRNRRFYGRLYELIPEADRKIFLRALCIRCADGTEAPFTIEKIPLEGQENIGGTDVYEAVCRKHYEEVETSRLRGSNEQS